MYGKNVPVKKQDCIRGAIGAGAVCRQPAERSRPASNGWLSSAILMSTIMHSFLLTAAALATLFGSVVSAGTAQSAQVQTSTGGTINGHGAPNRPNVTEFLGIRFAAAPVGELRFAAPQKYVAPQDTVFEASEWVRLSIAILILPQSFLTRLVSVCTQGMLFRNNVDLNTVIASRISQR